MTVEEPKFKEEAFCKAIGRSLWDKLKAKGHSRFDNGMSAHIKSEWKMHEVQLSMV